MSITDPNADAVQPDEGQGDGGTSDAPYSEHLARIPEELRDQVEPVFKDWDGQVTKRFQDAADFRKQWEPLKDTGVNQLSPDEVAWLVQFRGALDDPQTMQQWWEGYAQEHGLNQNAQQAQEPQTLDDFGSFGDPQQLQSAIDQAVGPLKKQLEDFQVWQQEQQAAQQHSQLVTHLESQVAEIEKKLGAPLSEKQKTILARFASAYDDENTAIPRGWEDMQSYNNDIEKQALQAKVNSPSPAEGGGVPDTSPERFTSLNAPGFNETATEWMRNNRG